MKVLVLLFLVALTTAFSNKRPYTVDDAAAQFEDFIKTFNKHYATDAEKAKRFEIFKKNLELIDQMNSESDTDVHGITKFADLTKEEFLTTYTGYRGDMLRKDVACEPGTVNNKSPPDSFSWKDKNVISKAKNQERCGSCWAFSAIGNVEAHYAIKHQNLLDLSEQQVVDCDKNSFGCGGSYSLDYPFVYLNGSGAMLEDDYPYKGKDGKCQFDASKVKVRVTNCLTYDVEKEDELRNIVYSGGPITIGVDARDMQYYHGGILKNCTLEALNHAVLIVGYGSENGTPFWLIKNSWGESFGEKGFIRIERGVNACGLMDSDAVEAVVE